MTFVALGPENSTISDGEYFYISEKPSENVTLFVSEAYPKSRRKSPENATIAGIFCFWPESVAGHGGSRDRSGKEALGLLVRMAVTACPAATWFAGIEVKRRRKTLEIRASPSPVLRRKAAVGTAWYR